MEAMADDVREIVSRKSWPRNTTPRNKSSEKGQGGNPDLVLLGVKKAKGWWAAASVHA